MRRGIAAAILVAWTASASANPHKILVLQTEGRADAGTRAKIDTALTKLASTGGTLVSQGDITFSDAAAGVGCSPEVATCRDEVLGMLAVDEVVYATTTFKPGGTEIEVRRVTRGGMIREAKTMLATGQSADKLDGLAPLFSQGKPVDPVGDPTTPSEPRPANGLPSVSDAPPALISTKQGRNSQVDEPPAPPRRRLQLAGMIGGGVSMTIGFLLWGEAQTIQEEVDTHPTQTAAQLDDLKILEARGDAVAGWGNLLFLSGVALAGVSTYFYIKGRRSQTGLQSARIAPAVFDHGAGLTLTFGGSP